MPLIKASLLSEQLQRGAKPHTNSARSDWKQISKYLELWGHSTAYTHLIDTRFNLPSPQGIQSALNRLVLGQNEATQMISRSFYFQMLARELAARGKFSEPEVDSYPAFLRREPILLHGPTGVGKTHLVNEAAKLCGLNFEAIDASSLVPQGIVGISLNEVFKRIAHQIKQGDDDARFTVVFFDEVDKLIQKGDLQAEFLRMLEGFPFAISSHSREQWQVGPTETMLDTSQFLIVLGGAWQTLEDSKSARSIGFINYNLDSRPSALSDLTTTGGMSKELLGRIKH